MKISDETIAEVRHVSDENHRARLKEKARFEVEDAWRPPIEAFIRALTVLSPVCREAMMDELRAKVCIECGAPDPNCPCWEREEAEPS